MKLQRVGLARAMRDQQHNLIAIGCAIQARDGLIVNEMRERVALLGHGKGTIGKRLPFMDLPRNHICQHPVTKPIDETMWREHLRRDCRTEATDPDKDLTPIAIHLGGCANARVTRLTLTNAARAMISITSPANG